MGGGDPVAVSFVVASCGYQRYPENVRTDTVCTPFYLLQVKNALAHFKMKICCT